MRKAVLYIAVALVSMFAPSGAGAAAGQAAKAPVEVPAETYCAECGMRVRGDGLRFASEIILKDGKVRCFCDVGDMLIHYEVHKKKEDIAAIYVKDYVTGAWAEGREAYYLADAKVVTPMRFGILAFAGREAAEKFKAGKGGGKIYTFQEIIASRIFRR
ncbi:MAG TPA: nitrous oxide reductase accessory protein NosL [Nitrospirota bacterium]|nr:nitrous oxide reductase accessory protein NosL [Nitrospirota bacterium]